MPRTPESDQPQTQDDRVDLEKRRFLPKLACLTFALWTTATGLVEGARLVGAEQMRQRILARNPRHFEDLQRYTQELENNPAIKGINCLWALRSTSQKAYRTELNNLLEAFRKTASLPKGINEIQVLVHLQNSQDPWVFSLARINAAPAPFIKPDGQNQHSLISQENRGLQITTKNSPPSTNPVSNILSIAIDITYDSLSIDIDNLPDPLPTNLGQQFPLTTTVGTLQTVQHDMTYFGPPPTLLSNGMLVSQPNPEGQPPLVYKNRLKSYYLQFPQQVGTSAQYDESGIYHPDGQITNFKQSYTSDTDDRGYFPIPAQLFFDALRQEYLITLLSTPSTNQVV